MIAIHQNKVLDCQELFVKDIERHYKNAVNNLEELELTSSLELKEKKYLQKVIKLFKDNPDILTWLPNILIKEKNKFPSIPYINITIKGKVEKVKSKIAIQIIRKLGYVSKRKSFYPKYFKEIGIKTCVYCNSQLTISAKKTVSGYSAKFDVDHYHSKDEHPFLSICLFNLYPSCAPCNRAKGVKEVEFELYTDDISKTLMSKYRFKLAPHSIAKYLTTKDSSEIEFTFNEPTYKNLKAENFCDVFSIEGIYKTQDDLIEELIIKSQIYNQSYIKVLKNNFNKLSLNPELFKRTLVGNYIKDRDMHKRPMSKFVQDIARDLGLID